MKIRPLKSRELFDFERLFDSVLETEFDYYTPGQKETIKKRWNGESLKKMYTNPSYCFVVAELKGKLVGFSVGKITKRKIAFGRFTGVLPEYQGQGIGTKMKLKVENWAREVGACEIRSSTYKKENFGYLKRMGYKFYKEKTGQGVDKTRYVFTKKLP